MWNPKCSFTLIFSVFSSWTGKKNPPQPAGDQYSYDCRNYLVAGLSGLTVEVVSPPSVEPVSVDIPEVVSIGALCIGAAEESAFASSEVELSVHDAMIDVMATIARNFFI